MAGKNIRRVWYAPKNSKSVKLPLPKHRRQALNGTCNRKLAA
jgi:hypothetical protein